MGAGEKKSLTNSSQKNIKMPERNVKLHYFPDIPQENSSNRRRCEPQENRFNRVYFDRVDSSCSDGCQTVKEDMVSITASRIKEIEDQAYQKGFVAGEKAGLESRTKQIQSVLESLHQALFDLQILRQQIYDTIEKEVVELSLAIARKVVCQEVTTNKDLVVCVAKEALSKVKVPGEITVKLNPSDLQVINDAKSHLGHLLNRIDNVSFEPEETISSGGCVIETNMGEIDARLEKQFQVVEEMFQAELHKSRTSDPETA